MKDFAKLYTAVAEVEKQYGLGDLEKEEKQIFAWIVSQMATGKEVRVPDMVDKEITSRASTYRHINSLKNLSLIEMGRGGRRDIVNLPSRLKTYNKTLLKAISKFK